jgi:hypothetical protein
MLSVALRATPSRRERRSSSSATDGRLLDQLLVAALDRALALAQRDARLPSPSTCTSMWRGRPMYRSR